MHIKLDLLQSHSRSGKTSLYTTFKRWGFLSFFLLFIVTGTCAAYNFHRDVTEFDKAILLKRKRIRNLSTLHNKLEQEQLELREKCISILSLMRRGPFHYSYILDYLLCSIPDSVTLDSITFTDSKLLLIGEGKVDEILNWRNDMSAEFRYIKIEIPYFSKREKMHSFKMKFLLMAKEEKS